MPKPKTTIDFSSYFNSISFSPSLNKKTSLSKLKACQIATHNGIAIGDFYDPKTWKKLNLVVPNGIYCVELALAETEEHITLEGKPNVLKNGSMVAAARVCLSSDPVTKWKKLSSISIDSGWACFLSGEMMEDSSIKADSWEDEMNTNSDAFDLRTIYPKAKLNAAAACGFSSGQGDGSYTCYGGYAADGTLVNLTLDFDTLWIDDYEIMELKDFSPGEKTHDFLKKANLRLRFEDRWRSKPLNAGDIVLRIESEVPFFYRDLAFILHDGRGNEIPSKADKIETRDGGRTILMLKWDAIAEGGQIQKISLSVPGGQRKLGSG